MFDYYYYYYCFRSDGFLSFLGYARKHSKYYEVASSFSVEKSILNGQYTFKSKDIVICKYSDSENEPLMPQATNAKAVLQRYGTEPNIDSDVCPLEWWKLHAGAHPLLAN